MAAPDLNSKSTLRNNNRCESVFVTDSDSDIRNVQLFSVVMWWCSTFMAKIGSSWVLASFWRQFFFVTFGWQLWKKKFQEQSWFHMDTMEGSGGLFGTIQTNT